ncbi:DUF1538 family protein [Methanospirillum sp. J.3.6.1-F.2.7.3]|uniref:DUF1538 family protein n=1 Tax=Methanospirillum purgamenti TaxID=2834276 RepID=A0A8E7AWR7_9EURY|nr:MULTISPECIES: DUF1538 domain-containing protein [Methanospirillum]MDX8550471.1 DUF1538 domain-containing protein [Methanospirillum hungatei]QVV88165.1 DUF1538 family protein [Methanospirillum sp. J.3.6.1-F.2.7.3]
MMSDFIGIVREVTQAIVPIVTLIFLIMFFLPGNTPELMAQFLIGSIMVVLGITLFLLGVEVGLLPMGEAIGTAIPRSGSIFLVILIAFLFGVLATIAEPDVRVLAMMIQSVTDGGMDKTSLILVIAIGVGFFVATAMVRIIYNIPIAYLFAIGYGAVIILSLFTSPEYVPIAFDAGGVTTGPITVPFILSLGIGITSTLGNRTALSDGFGLIGLASIGPMLGVMLAGALV